MALAFEFSISEFRIKIKNSNWQPADFSLARSVFEALQHDQTAFSTLLSASGDIRALGSPPR
jgi:hypothetical protein